MAKNVYALEAITLPELQPKPLHGLAKDLTGKQFGSLVALWSIGPDPNGKGVQWLCLCTSCGSLKVTITERLSGGSCQSCGCLQRSRSSAAMRKANADRHARRMGYRSAAHMIACLTSRKPK